MKTNNNNKVIVAMSGGVDSSVAALLLLEAGYDVVGATIVTGYGRSAEQAAQICQQLAIPHYLIEAKSLFQQQVIQPFVDEYSSGRTPNPCVECNARLKFPVFLPLMTELGASYLATGHYVRKVSYNDCFTLQRALADEKDQTYFMYKLAPEILAKSLFPLGEYSKNEVRSLAVKEGLASAAQKDSYDICFIEDGDYRNCLSKFADIKAEPGDIIDQDGHILGQHKGLSHYTLGQRKGIDVALGYPAYVTGINTGNNHLILGQREELLSQSARVNDLRFLTFGSLTEPLKALVRVRYKAEPVWATITQEDDSAKIDFSEPVWAVTPGQSAVFYDNDILLGGGTII